MAPFAQPNYITSIYFQKEADNVKALGNPLASLTVRAPLPFPLLPEVQELFLREKKKGEEEEEETLTQYHHHQ